ncbi:MAG: signal peptidase II [Gemmatimonadota bacterium]
MRVAGRRANGIAGGPHGRRVTDREPHTGIRPVVWIAVAVVVLDWSTKAMVASAIPLRRMVEVIPDRVALWHVRNPAMILGLFGDLPLRWRQVLGVVLGIVAVTLLVEVLTRAHRLLPHRRPWAWVFGGLVFGGLIGNLGERALHWGVTDFLSFRWGSIWLPPGNVADLAIILSIPISFLVIAFEIEARALRGSTGAAAGAPKAARHPDGQGAR